MFKGEIVCFVVCFGFSGDAAPPTSDYCQRYERQVITKQDAEAIKRLPRNLRDRIQGNEVDYLCRCKNWDHPVCK